jgi:hypothetical protein
VHDGESSPEAVTNPLDGGGFQQLLMDVVGYPSIHDATMDKDLVSRKRQVDAIE